MVIPECCGRGTPRRSRHYSMRASLWQAYSRSAVLWRVRCPMITWQCTTDSLASQPFWGDMIAAAGAGPEPIPYRSLTSANLIEAIQFCLRPEAQIAAQSIAGSMSREEGVKTAAASFYANLPASDMYCDLLNDQPAVWEYQRKGKRLKLSGVAAEILINRLKVDCDKLKV